MRFKYFEYVKDFDGGPDEKEETEVVIRVLAAELGSDPAKPKKVYFNMRRHKGDAQLFQRFVKGIMSDKMYIFIDVLNESYDE